MKNKFIYLVWSLIFLSASLFGQDTISTKLASNRLAYNAELELKDLENRNFYILLDSNAIKNEDGLIITPIFYNKTNPKKKLKIHFQLASLEPYIEIKESPENDRVNFNNVTKSASGKPLYQFRFTYNKDFFDPNHPLEFKLNYFSSTNPTQDVIIKLFFIIPNHKKAGKLILVDEEKKPIKARNVQFNWELEEEDFIEKVLMLHNEGEQDIIVKPAEKNLMVNFKSIPNLSSDTTRIHIKPGEYQEIEISYKGLSREHYRSQKNYNYSKGTFSKDDESFRMYGNDDDIQTVRLQDNFGNEIVIRPNATIQFKQGFIAICLAFFEKSTGVLRALIAFFLLLVLIIIFIPIYALFKRLFSSTSNKTPSKQKASKLKSQSTFQIQKSKWTWLPFWGRNPKRDTCIEIALEILEDVRKKQLTKLNFKPYSKNELIGMLALQNKYLLKEEITSVGGFRRDKKRSGKQWEFSQKFIGKLLAADEKSTENYFKQYYKSILKEIGNLKNKSKKQKLILEFLSDLYDNRIITDCQKYKSKPNLILDIETIRQTFNIATKEEERINNSFRNFDAKLDQIGAQLFNDILDKNKEHDDLVNYYTIEIADEIIKIWSNTNDKQNPHYNLSNEDSGLDAANPGPSPNGSLQVDPNSGNSDDPELNIAPEKIEQIKVSFINELITHKGNNSFFDVKLRPGIEQLERSYQTNTQDVKSFILDFITNLESLNKSQWIPKQSELEKKTDQFINKLKEQKSFKEEIQTAFGFENKTAQEIISGVQTLFTEMEEKDKFIHEIMEEADLFNSPNHYASAIENIKKKIEVEKDTEIQTLEQKNNQLEVFKSSILQKLDLDHSNADTAGTLLSLYTGVKNITSSLLQKFSIKPELINSIESLPEVMPSFDNKFDHLIKIQRKWPTEYQNYKDMLYRVENNAKYILQEMDHQSAFYPIVNNLLTGDNNNAGIKRALNNINEVDFLREKLGITQLEELHEVTNLDFFIKIVKPQFIKEVVDRIVILYHYKSIKTKRYDMNLDFQKDKIPVHELDTAYGYIRSILAANFHIHLAHPIHLCKDVFDPEIHAKYDYSNINRLGNNKYGSIADDIEKWDVIFDIREAGYTSGLEGVSNKKTGIVCK